MSRHEDWCTCALCKPETRKPWPYPDSDLNGTRTDKEVGW